MEFMHLVGTEQVQQAAATMVQAAREMQAAANALEWSLEQQRRFMDDWLARLVEATENVRATPGGAA